jgi:tRNA pseudouridine55 synthase
VDAVRLVDKPAGVTSHDVVAAVRRELPRGTKVGHAGTLDPFATGLLLVLIGRATRAQRFFMGQPKTYVAQARFGWISDTGDPEGQVTETGRIPPEPLHLPTGRLRQRPPAYSAVKVDGRRAYERARAGEQVEVPEREVEVHRFERLGDDEFLIECSAGTYIRTLIADLGDAYCTALRRTAIGPFSLAEAGDELALGEALARVMPTVRLDVASQRRAVHGMPVAGVVKPGTEHVLLLDGDGPVAIAQPREGGQLKPVVGFRSSPGAGM